MWREHCSSCVPPYVAHRQAPHPPPPADARHPGQVQAAGRCGNSATSPSVPSRYRATKPTGRYSPPRRHWGSCAPAGVPAGAHERPSDAVPPAMSHSWTFKFLFCSWETVYVCRAPHATVLPSPIAQRTVVTFAVAVTVTPAAVPYADAGPNMLEGGSAHIHVGIPSTYLPAIRGLSALEPSRRIGATARRTTASGAMADAVGTSSPTGTKATPPRPLSHRALYGAGLRVVPPPRLMPGRRRRIDRHVRARAVRSLAPGAGRGVVRVGRRRRRQSKPRMLHVK